MNKNLMIVLAGGFMIALLVAFIVRSGIDKSPQVSDASTVEILVAAKNIPLGAELDSIDMKWQSWPESAVFVGAIVRQEDQNVTDALSGRVRRDVASGEPLSELALLSSGVGNIVASSLEPGKRAIAIKVSAESMVGGFINPGDHVDVILTHKVRVPNDDKSVMRGTVDRFATETVLENVRVLAIDQRATNSDTDKAKVGRTITLEVTANEAEKIALVAEMGDLSLSLRPVGDESKNAANADITTDVSVSKILQEIAKRSGDGGGTSKTIRVYSGDGARTIKVRNKSGM